MMMDAGRVMFLVFRNVIIKHISQSAVVVIDVVLYKALPCIPCSREFTQYLDKHWGCGRDQ
jgi:hypothetical protein